VAPPESTPVARLGNEWFIPLLPVARALNVELTIAPGSPTLRARRQDGSELTYDFRTGEIRDRYILIGNVKRYQDVKPSASADTLLFPVSGIVVLFGVDVVEEQGNVLEIASTSTAGSDSRSVPGLNVSGINYRYGLTTNGRKLAQFVDLSGDALIGGIRAEGKAILIGYPGRRFMGLSQGSLRLEWPEDNAVILGNQHVSSGVDALSSAALAAAYERVIGGFRSSMYVGRAVGATQGSIGLGGPTYDTTVAGMSFNRSLSSGDISLGANLFRGDNRSGNTVGFSYRAPASSRNQLKAQALFGKFSGLSSRTILVRSSPEPTFFKERDETLIVSEDRVREKVDGTAAAFSIADSFTPVRQLTLSGQYEVYGKNFLSVNDDSRFNAQTTRAVSATVRPASFFSFNAGVNERRSSLGAAQARQGAASRGDPSIARTLTYGANASIPHGVPVQFGFFRSIQKDPGSPLSDFVMTQYSAGLPALGRYTANVMLSDMNFKGEKTRNLNTTVTANYAGFGQIAFHNQIQFGSSNRAGVELMRELSKGAFRVGVDRVFGRQGSSGFAPTASLQLNLPRGRTIQVSYIGNGRSHLLQVEIGGRLRQTRELELDSRGTPRAVGNAPLTGRVYLDSDADGKFDSAKDRAVSGVVVWLDDTASATTDEQGMYRFDQMEPGAHQIRSDIANVPADMTFAGAAERTVSLAPYRNNTQDLRLVKTGRVLGKVLYMDYTDPDNPVERPLPDARVIATDRLDTFSEVDGHFLLGDMPPGEYAFRLDPATVPSNYTAQQGVVSVTVKAGETVDGILFELVVPPKPVIQRTLPPLVAGQ
jgi:hypothetical protein